MLFRSEYAGTIISINEVGLADETSGEVALDFNFIQKPKDKTEDDLKSENFNKVMADIINDILEKAINEYKD